GDERPQRVLELARSARAFIDRLQNEPWQATARDLCSDGIAVRTGQSIEVVRRVHRWIDLPESRALLQAYAEYEQRCRRSSAPVGEVRRAIAGLVVTCPDVSQQTRARVLAATVQTACEFGIPPFELTAEIRGLAALPLVAAPANDWYALD